MIERAPFAEVAVHVVTGPRPGGWPAERDAALASGMNDYVPKPISQDAIATAISRWRETLIAAKAADDNKM